MPPILLLYISEASFSKAQQNLLTLGVLSVFKDNKMTSTVEIKRFLQQWDDSPKQNRVEILRDFNSKNQNKTAPELDQALGNCASLFFTRITAWLRLSYLFIYLCTFMYNIIYVIIMSLISFL